MRSRILNVASGFLGATLLLAASASMAATTTYFGTQAPKSPLVNNPTPPALTTAVQTQMALFTNKIVSLGRNEYENGVNAGQGNFNYTGGTATLSGGSVVGALQSSPQFGRYNMTAGVPNDPTLGGAYGHWLEGSADFSYTFSTAVTALSFFATDVGDFGGNFILNLYSGNTLVFTSGRITNPVTDTLGLGNGNLLFFGVVTDVAFNKATFSIAQASSTTTDIIGIDSLVVGTAVVPEPTSVALVGLALAAAGLSLRRRGGQRAAA